MGAPEVDTPPASGDLGDGGRSETTQPVPAAALCIRCKAHPRVKGRRVCQGCKTDMNRTYMREYMRERYRRRHAEAIELLGGCCKICGSTEDLEFSRIEPRPDGKGGSPTRWFVGSRVKFLEDLTRLLLLCKPCRLRIISEKTPHGGGVAGKHNCRCEPCKIRRAEWFRDYRSPERRRARIDNIIAEVFGSG